MCCSSFTSLLPEKKNKQSQDSSFFHLSSVFDSLLYRPREPKDTPQYNEVQGVLRDEIVNPLRKNMFVGADNVMKLRRLLEKHSSVSGLTSEEKGKLQ